MANNAAHPYRRLLLPLDPSPVDLRAVASDYSAMLRSVLVLVLDRFDRTPGYPWTDTKLSVLTGEDFAADDPVRGRDAVYGWIQGRALEALAGHARWLAESGDGDSLGARIVPVARTVLDALRAARARNGGHAFFLMTSAGEPRVLGPTGAPEPIVLSPESPYNFSDLFCAKGMYAAAHFLGDADAANEARDWCAAVADALFAGEFASDQQPLDPTPACGRPKNPVKAPPGRISHGPFMIAIGMARLLVEHGHERAGIDLGLRLIDYVRDRHVNRDGRWPGLRPYDYVEFVDAAGRPWESDGRILHDPGHALEFVGLALRFADAVRTSGIVTEREIARIDAAEREMPAILDRAFGYGYREGLGICKLVDLRTGVPVNTDMPWWALPETMRAALGCARIARDDEARASALRTFAACHNAFAERFVRADRHLMAVQTIDATGRPADVIPATPDADPGYHTGLALIDCLRMVDALCSRA